MNIEVKLTYFQVNADGSSLSHTFEALAYDDENQVQVERIITVSSFLLYKRILNKCTQLNYIFYSVSITQEFAVIFSKRKARFKSSK